MTTTADRTLIFSLLKFRKKTSTVIAGVMIGTGCLWGIAMWQDIGPRQLFVLFLGSFAFLLAIMILAILLIVAIKGIASLVGKKTKDHRADTDSR